MIFLRHESFRSYLRLYPGTSIFILLNLIYFAVVGLTGSTKDGYHLLEYGALISHPVYMPYGMEEPWRFITAMFMHAGVDHLLFNMFALIIFAPPLEGLIKTPRYALLYLLSGLGGGLLSVSVNTWFGSETHLAVGASGAIYGIYGAYLFIALFRKSIIDTSSIKTIYMILGFGVISSIVVSKIDLWGHLGGALTGFLLYALIDKLRMSKIRST